MFHPEHALSVAQRERETYRRKLTVILVPDATSPLKQKIPWNKGSLAQS